MIVTDVVEYIHDQCAIARPQLVDIQVVEGIIGYLIVINEIPGNGFTIERPEQLSWCVPELSRLI